MLRFLALFFGAWLLASGIHMSEQHVVSYQTTQGTKGRNAALGAVSGALLCGGYVAVFGAIGLATMGTAVPVGAVTLPLACAAFLGASGAATGDKEHSIKTVTQRYPPRAFLPSVIIGTMLVTLALSGFLRSFRRRSTAPD